MDFACLSSSQRPGCGAEHCLWCEEMWLHQSACITGRRVRILADLHWKLARPLTAAEQRLRDITLPGLEAAVARLQHSLEVTPSAHEYHHLPTTSVVALM